MGTRSLPGPATRLGKYELIERLAVGGMAEIHLARAVGIEGFQKLVVCKCILPHRAADAEFVRMFLDEARLAATLHHPNIAQAFDIGCEQGLHFFTMEYVEGADVREIVQAAWAPGGASAGVPLEQAVTIALGVAAGLHYAHEKTDAEGQPQGIVHRDVSPSNVLVSFDGGVKLVDFGIAKAGVLGAHTQTGTTKGKVSCMSPEQCRGEAVDRRTDIFALGVLLYELTTGVRPYQADSEYAIIRKIVDEDAAPPGLHRPDYPPRLAAIVARALARPRDERYASAQELQIDLEAFAQEAGLAISSVELARYMRELFGGRRPRRIDEAAEDFLHRGLRTREDTGDDATDADVAVAPPAVAQTPSPRLRRSAIGTAAALIFAALAGGGYWLGARHHLTGAAAGGRSLPPAVAASTATAAPVPAPEPIPARAPPPLASDHIAPVVAAPPRVAAPSSHRRHARTKVARTQPAHPARQPLDLDAPFPR